MSENIISCDLFDYIEVACLYGYEVKLKLKDDQVLIGKAINVTTSGDRREFLIIDNGQKQQVDLAQLAYMHVLTPDAKFHDVSFVDMPVNGQVRAH
ncbi:MULTISPECIES: Rho-binding antiterminator [unclassified Methylobacter]|uniref:Rho-binding antiterminator n=1 Tax=unclassified Methylobacter TaxID=2635283 RepID=UPI001895AD45|nr:Rho-binding antiterminator [Methylobacter sp. BlB1]MBF6650058.1 Rho-binding antiterminator [Methylobacter sp. BlB1]